VIETSLGAARPQNFYKTLHVFMGLGHKPDPIGISIVMYDPSYDQALFMRIDGHQPEEEKRREPCTPSVIRDSELINLPLTKSRSLHFTGNTSGQR